MSYDAASHFGYERDSQGVLIADGQYQRQESAGTTERMITGLNGSGNGSWLAPGWSRRLHAQ